MVQRYRTRISGPLLDRIDIQIEVPAVAFRELASEAAAERIAAAHVAEAIQYRSLDRVLSWGEG